MAGALVAITGDYPIAVIDAEHRYVEVSVGWAATYSPGEGPEWWVGRDHFATFKLDCPDTRTGGPPTTVRARVRLRSAWSY